MAQAIEDAGLTLQDFAAVCKPAYDGGTWGIRYGEIVSLNTWQIQKAKKRITALEQEV